MAKKTQAIPLVIHRDEEAPAITCMEALQELLKEDDVVFIGNVKFVVSWQKGALMLVPKWVNDALYTYGFTREQIDDMSGNEMACEVKKIYAGLGMWESENKWVKPALKRRGESEAAVV